MSNTSAQNSGRELPWVRAQPHGPKGQGCSHPDLVLLHCEIYANKCAHPKEGVLLIVKVQWSKAIEGVPINYGGCLGNLPINSPTSCDKKSRKSTNVGTAAVQEPIQVAQTITALRHQIA